MFRHLHQRKRRRGALTVEFALTAPIFFLFVFAGIEFARIHMIQNSMENAAFEGARRGIVPGATANDCKQVAESLVDIIGLKDVTVTVSPSTFTTSTESITVDIQVPITASNGFGLTGFMSGKSMATSISMPIEWSD